MCKIFQPTKSIIKNMKKFSFGIALLAAIALVGCKSSESSYKKAYEKAKAQEMSEQTIAQPVTVTPVETVTPVQQSVTPVDNSDLRTERLTPVNNGTLKSYNVVCGSFKNLDNANNLRSTLQSKGYNAQVAQNPDTGMYRVIASSFDDRGSAVSSRDVLRATYPDAWILLRAY